MFALRSLSQSLIFFQKPTLLLLPLMATSQITHSSFTTTTSSPKRVGTHNGTFHCDEALGCYMIRLTDKFNSVEIVRTRDSKVLETLDAVLDVGGVYDESKDRYDHHQKGFEEVFGHGFGTKLSSAGLVYKLWTLVPFWVFLGACNTCLRTTIGVGVYYYIDFVGRDSSDTWQSGYPEQSKEKHEVLNVGKGDTWIFIAMFQGFLVGQCEAFGFPFGVSQWLWSLEHYGMEIIAKELKLDQGHPDVHHLFLAVYKSFVEAIDANDNGINKYDTDLPKRYVDNTKLPSRVGRLNLDWMDLDNSAEKENEAFHRAMSLAGSEFIENVRFYARSWLPARSIVIDCLAARGDVDASGEIMKLHKFCPVRTHFFFSNFLLLCLSSLFYFGKMWKLHIYELEEEMKIDPPIKYVLYEADRSKNWRVQAVAVSPDKFESRKPLPAQWRGLRDEELSKESSIPGCVFVHMSGFIGGNATYDGALAMARASLNN
ncbi:hypothetical protein IFM89_006299 [Coptis chinensis]|uniref:Metal-dependent protein hydrolase n=1 Tax=Coptis chinensis TaxID=261450 RepID=A0A835GW03_9MAGN|nr:hypothetical protein IFM89_006299 [Coptis chinensis]